MTKQEEIREGVRLIWNDYKFGETIHENSTWVVDAILTYLDSQGVVIKVERGVPQMNQPTDKYRDDWVDGYLECEKNWREAGYTAVDSLI